MTTNLHGKILIIDDEPDINTALKILLIQDGHEILTAARAREGLSLLDDFPADVILSDLMMPEMNGFELLHTLRNKKPLIPIVVVSAYDSREQILKALQEGAYDFIGKPFDIELVKNTVLRALEYHHLLIERESQRQNEAIMALAGAVAHELNQPLTVILGHIFMLQKELDDLGIDIRTRMSQVTESAEMMAIIVQKLSKITHYETQTYVEDVAIVDLDKATDA